MKKRSVKPAVPIPLWEEEHEEMDHELKKLQESLAKMAYEGKASLGRNLKAASETAVFFQKELPPHLDAEEKVIYPYLRKHIPKLDSVIGILTKEHSEIRRTLKKFCTVLSGMIQDERRQPARIQEVRDTGNYLLYVIRIHMKIEQESLYQAVNRDLSLDEQRELNRCLGDFAARERLTA